MDPAHEFQKDGQVVDTALAPTVWPPPEAAPASGALPPPPPCLDRQFLDLGTAGGAPGPAPQEPVAGLGVDEVTNVEGDRCAMFISSRRSSAWASLKVGNRRPR